MKYALLITILLSGCFPLEELKETREEYRECLKDRIELVDKISVMKVPEVPECPKEVQAVFTPELDKAATRDKCLYIINRLGAGTFRDKEQAFRTCWDRLDNAHIDTLYECQDALQECQEGKDTGR